MLKFILLKIWYLEFELLESYFYLIKLFKKLKIK